jgi:hypothetical protein
METKKGHSGTKKATGKKATETHTAVSGSGAKPLDISNQLADRGELAGKPRPLPQLNNGAWPRRIFVIGHVDASGHLRERVVTSCFWKDMRSVPVESLPAITWPTYNLWSIEALPDDPKRAGANEFMGMLYRSPDGQTVLAATRTVEDAALDSFIGHPDHYRSDCASDDLTVAIGGRGEDGTILISAPNCERSRPVSLSSYLYVRYSTTRAAAISAAVAQAQVYADGIARARGRLELCDAPCHSCSSGSANVTITNRDSFVSLIASAFYGEWRYVGYAEFDYTFSVGCCLRGTT